MNEEILPVEVKVSGEIIPKVTKIVSFSVEGQLEQVDKFKGTSRLCQEHRSVSPLPKLPGRMFGRGHREGDRVPQRFLC